jgi:hypothetical protein
MENLTNNPAFIQHVNREFELRFLRVRGLAFQDFVADVMENAYPGDFRRIRPHGNAGDLKCDGYLESEGTVFQVYGPEEIRSVSRLLRKIDEDFSGARVSWAGRMKRWIFVHNSRQGLPAQAIQKLSDLGEGQHGIEVDSWGFEELRNLISTISDARLRAMFPDVGLSDPAGHPLVHLPEEPTRIRYWEWLRTHLDESLRSSALVSTANLTLPIRVASPESVEEFFRRQTIFSERGNDSPGPGPNNRTPELTVADFIGIANLPRTLKEHQSILIEGGSAAGKSTLLRHFALRESEHLLRRGPSRASRRTPVLIDLARFSFDRTIRDLLLTSVNRSGIDISSEQFASAGQRGYLLYLMDGLDEVPTGCRHECLAQISTLMDRNPGCKLVVTSRPFPNPPRWLFRLSVAPYSDSDIALALRVLFGSNRLFRNQFNWYNPDDYVRAKLRPEVRQMCRSPLTLGMILSLLKNGTELPNELFAVYERFTSWLMDWEGQNYRLRSHSATIAALEELAYSLQARGAIDITLAEWIRTTGVAIQKLLRETVASLIDAEAVTAAILSTGLIRNINGQISFSHKTFQEFLVARHVLSSGRPPHLDSAALDMGVARFLCSRMEDVTDLLEEHLARTDDVQNLWPLLAECSREGCSGGRFEPLHDAIALGTEMDIELTYGLRGPDIENFTDDVNRMVQTCVAFKPKALSVLKRVAWDIMMGTPWDESPIWFESVVSGLEAYGWEGAPFHRKLLEAKYFDQLEVFDCETEAGEHAYDELCEYLKSVTDDDFDKARKHFDVVIRCLMGDAPIVEEDPNQGRLPFDSA